MVRLHFVRIERVFVECFGIDLPNPAVQIGYLSIAISKSDSQAGYCCEEND
jgi:hypothetical protein